MIAKGGLVAVQLRLEDVPRPRGRGPIGSRWNGRIGEWVEEAGSSSAPPPPRAAGAVATAVAEEEEEAVAPLASRAVDFLILALAEGPLDRDTLIEKAEALGCQNKNLEVYLRQRKREEDGYITLYLERFELTRKGRDQVAALGGPVVVVSPDRDAARKASACIRRVYGSYDSEADALHALGS